MSDYGTEVDLPQVEDEMIGRILDRKYKLVRMLGEGGMGCVYEAEHVRINRKVAVKVMHESYTKRPDAVERFLREAQSASAIGHPNIVEVHDVVQEEDGTTFIVMELLKGETLESVLQKKKKIPPARAVSIILQALSALTAAHKKGIIHRDLKPDNLFLAVDARMREEVKLLDFGVAKIQDTGKDEMGLTKTGTVLGTPYYLAPEQAKGGKDIDQRIDIWSVGVILYEALSGEVPFQGDNYNEILGKILLEEPRPLGEMAPELPAGLVETVMKALAKDRDKRYLTVPEMIEALLPFRDDKVNALTPTVEKALRNSVVPPPDKGGTGQVPLRRSGPVRRIIEKLKDSLNARTLDSEDYVLVEEPRAEAASRRKWIIAGGAAGLAVLLIAGVALLFGGGEKRVRPAPAPAPIVRKPAAPPVSQGPAPAPAPAPIAGKPDAPPVSLKAAPPPPPAPALPQQVQIELVGMPAGAWVLLNQRRVLLPITLPRSEKPQTIKVIALGYQPYSQSFVPDSDKRFTVVMKKRPPAPAKASPTSSQDNGKLGSQKKKRGEVWTSNPF